MSDGPHRSLNMRPGWKRLAKVADNRASDPEEIREAVLHALERDWRADVSDKLNAAVCDILGGQEDSLFKDDKLARLTALRKTAAGHELGQLYVDCAIREVSTGKAALDTPQTAAIQALAIWGSRGGLQVEEHYRRESTAWRTGRIRGRLDEGIAGANLPGLARRLTTPGTPSAPRKISKQQGLDDGVRL